MGKLRSSGKSKGKGTTSGKGKGKGKGTAGRKAGATLPAALEIKECRVELGEESRDEILDLIHHLLKGRAESGRETAAPAHASSAAGEDDVLAQLAAEDGDDFDFEGEDPAEGASCDEAVDDHHYSADECVEGSCGSGSDDSEDISAMARNDARLGNSTSSRASSNRKRHLLNQLIEEDRHEAKWSEVGDQFAASNVAAGKRKSDKSPTVRLYVCEESKKHQKPKGPLTVSRGGADALDAFLQVAKKKLGIKGKKELKAYVVGPGGKVCEKLESTINLPTDQLVAISEKELTIDKMAKPPAASPSPLAEAAAGALDAVRAAYAKRAQQGSWSAVGQNLLTKEEADRLSTQLAEHAKAYASQEEHRAMREARSALPAAGARRDLLAALEQSQVVIVVGETGSGKTTQCPNFILEAASEAGRGGEVSILCTQPRRIAAVSVAERVAQERGEEPGSIVGHAVRLDSRASKRTRLLFCTTGVLLQRLNSSPDLQGITHVVVDEAHERSIHTDFLLMLLREVLERRADLRVVVMSATLEQGLFEKYFAGFTYDPSEDLPVVRISGRTFPVSMRYARDAKAAISGRTDIADSAYHEPARGDRGLEAWVRRVHSLENADEILVSPEVTKKADYDLIADLCGKILRGYLGPVSGEADDGAILIFLPGYAEIERCMRVLRNHPSVGDRAWILPLHGSMAIGQQHRVFLRPPQGQRKIIVATNIAETSITIDDVTHVIDPGHVRETRYSPESAMTVFSTVWVSRSAAQQRAGRASRTRPGVCWRLYEQSFMESALPAHTLCELRRTALEELVLQLRLLEPGTDPGDFLEKVIEPPSREAVAAAIGSLVSIGALGNTPEMPLTPLGFHLAHMPVDARTGKMLVYAALCQCLAPMLTIAACLAHRSPFVRNFNNVQEEQQRKAREKTFGHLCSDHLAVVAAYDAYQTVKSSEDFSAVAEFCRDLGLSSSALDGIRQLRAKFLRHLAEIGFAESGAEDGGKAVNSHKDDLALVRCVLCAGLFPNVVQVQRQGSRQGVRTVLVSRELERCVVHPSSLNARQQQEFEANSGWLLYHTKVKTSQIFLQDSTLVGSIPLLLFGGGDLRVNRARTHIMVNGLIFRAKKEATVVLLKTLRREIDRLLLLKVSDPSVDLAQNASPLLGSVTRLLQLEARRVNGTWRRTEDQ